MPEAETHTRPRPRIESLSDLIFGLALSIGAIALVGNVNNINSGQLLLNDITVFGFSFVILISVWMRYTRMMSVLPLENRWTMALNTALLFAVSLEPFLFNVLQLDANLDKGVASVFYASDLGVMMCIMGGFSSVIASEDRNLIPKDMIREFRIEAITTFVAGALFFISLLPFFWAPGPNGLYWRFYLWIIPFGMSSIRRRSQAIIGEIKKIREK
jgi:uncharacterized membrane protein